MRFASPVDIPATRGSFYSCLPILGQFKQDELAGVLIGHKLSEKMSNQIITSCENQGIPCLKTKPAPSFSKIKFIPCRADDDFAGYTWDQIDQTVSEDKTLSEETKRL